MTTVGESGQDGVDLAARRQIDGDDVVDVRTTSAGEHFPHADEGGPASPTGSSSHWRGRDSRAKRSRVALRPQWRLHLTVLVAFATLLVALIDASPMRGTGDAGEYLMMADRIGHLHRPTLTQADIPRFQQEFANVGGYMGFGVAYRPGDPGPWQMNHFWAYSAVVAPVLRVTDHLHFNPVRAFTLVNCAMLLLALWVVLRRVHWAPALLVFAGPAIWWVDKIHTEVFTFSLLAMAFVLARERPRVAMVLIAVASTQNFPIGFIVPLVVVYAVLRDRSRLRQWGFWAALAVSGAIAVLNPLYYQITIGTTSPQSFNGGVDPRLPSLQQYVAPILDLNIGVAVAAPIIVLATLAALVVLCLKRRSTDWLLVAVAGVTLGWFLFSFAQTGNFNHGATASMTRYGMWMMPLSLLLFAEVERVTGWSSRAATLRPFVAVGGMLLLGASVAISVVGYHPKISDGMHRPTAVAAWVWNHHPTWDDPLPEIYWERNQPLYEGNALSVANRTCSKVLVVRGAWPSSCGGTHPSIPARCLPPKGSACYANRSGNRFDFVVVKGVPGVDAAPVEVGDLVSRLRHDGVSGQR